jgi:hypothetical protein
MGKKLKGFLAKIPTHRQHLLTDVWSDDWGRAWLGGMLVVVEDSGEMHHFIVGVEQLSSWSTDIAGQHGSATAITAMRSSWRSSLGLGDDFPPFGHSDNANAAKCVARGISDTHVPCVVHLLAIPFGKLLWQKKDSKGVLKPKLVPALVDAFESLRECARAFYKKPDRVLEWRKHNRVADAVADDDEANHPVPKFDSTAKWGSSATLAETCWVHKDRLIDFAAASSFKLSLPTVAQWSVVQESLPVLDVIRATIWKLQKRAALLADFAPAVEDMLRALRKLPGLLAAHYIEEFEKVAETHLEMVDLGPGRSTEKLVQCFPTVTHLAECASVAHPLHKRLAFLEDDRRDEILKIFKEVCAQVYKLEHPSCDLSKPRSANKFMDRKVAHRTKPSGEDSSARRGYELIQKARKEDELEYQDITGVKPADSASSLEEEIAQQVDAWVKDPLSKDPDLNDPLQWWGSSENVKHYDLLVPGAFFLLSFPAGTAQLERFFSYCGHFFGDKRSGHADLRTKAMLAHNGWRTNMDGYFDCGGACGKP